MSAPFQPGEVVARVGIPTVYFRVKKCFKATDSTRYGVLLYGVHIHDPNGLNPNMFERINGPVKSEIGKGTFDFRQLMGAKA